MIVFLKTAQKLPVFFPFSASREQFLISWSHKILRLYNINSYTRAFPVLVRGEAKHADRPVPIFPMKKPVFCGTKVE